MAAPPIVDLCPECAARWRAAQRAQYQARRVARRGESNTRVPVGPAAARIGRLAAAGWTYPKIAAEAGCSVPTIQRIVSRGRHDPNARTWSIYERRILAIRSRPDRRRRPVDNLEDVPELELDTDARAALRARGYSSSFVR